MRNIDDETLSSDETTQRTASGQCRFTGLIPGPYLVDLRVGETVSWGSQIVDINEDMSVELTPKVTRLAGSIRLGEEPIAAILEFRSRTTGAHVRARSRPDGSFSVRLPSVPRDIWDELSIEATSPLVKRTLHDVSLDRTSDDAVARLAIRLQQRTVTGTVVDESGHEVSPALVNVVDPRGNVMQVESADGRFELNGLDEGKHVFTAATRETETELPVEIALASDEESRQAVSLLVKPITRLSGEVQSIVGPVLGATVFIRPVTDPLPVLTPIPVDPSGNFETRLPPGTREVIAAVGAPGFAFRLFRLHPTGMKVAIGMDQRGGYLTVESTRTNGPWQPYLVHEGAAMLVSSVAFLANARWLREDEKGFSIAIPLAEHGTYSLCWLSPQERQMASNAALQKARCSTGFLAPHGTLTLTPVDVNATSTGS
jgi:hypothetical protein